jgi:transportin-3
VNPQLISCLTSWLREIPAASIAKSSLLDVLVNAISNDNSFEAAVDCFSTIFIDTKDVRESMEVIQLVYPRVIALRPKIQEAADADDSETLKGLTRIFAEAGENWAVLVAEMPNEFRGLVEAVLECCARDTERDALSVTFNFWYELKQMLVLQNFSASLEAYSDIYSSLVDVMVKHLQFPSPEGGDDKDLFEGDRELEENFREFRHRMGDVLKDCCEVITVTACLQKAYNIIQNWIATYASQATPTEVPHWQELEAPLFAMRAMGRMVSPEESDVLHQVIPLMVQIPDHEKLRFQAIMAIARYTEWTAQHPEFLQPQINFVVNAFNHSSTEVVRAAALAFRFFGTDCRKLLQGEVVNLHAFYDSVLDKLPTQSQEEVTEGAASVISAQPLSNIYASLKLYCDPVVERIKVRATKAKSGTDKDELELADTIGLLTIFINNVQPYYNPSEENQAVKYCLESMTILSTVADNFTSTPVLEALCRCWRSMVLAYRTAATPLLPDLAKQLSSGFERTHKGCFLWATDSILREFSEGAELVDATTSNAIYQFFEQQAHAFLQIMNDVPPGDLPDGEFDSIELGFFIANQSGSYRGLLPHARRRSYILSP